MHTTLGGIVQTLTLFLRKMYETVKADDASEKMNGSRPLRSANFVWGMFG